jgi:hypothetical protein
MSERDVNGHWRAIKLPTVSIRYFIGNDRKAFPPRRSKRSYYRNVRRIDPRRINTGNSSNQDGESFAAAKAARISLDSMTSFDTILIIRGSALNHSY